jgi:hypothetical protein
MRCASRYLVALAVVCGPAMAVAAPMAIEGEVMATESHWTGDASRIVTTATVHTDAGDVVVSQLGGTVDGLTMRTMPGPELLAPGMRVAIAAHPDVDLEQRPHVVVDGVKVLALPENFVRTGPTKAGHSLYWESGCIFVTIDALGTKEINGDNEFPVIDQCIATWNEADRACSFIEVMVEGKEDREVGKDYVNMIKFRDVSWCRPAIKDDPPRCYADSAAGITTAVYVDDANSPRDGAIVDADIEINGKNFAISKDGVSLGDPGNCKAELANTLTHELGHLHGLEHPCLVPGDPPRIDGNGNPVPLCMATSDPKIVEATMYNFQDCGETKKETLDVDDKAAVCAIYPISMDPGTCEPVSASTGCCSAAERTPPWAGLVLGGLTVVLLTRRRRH